MSGLAYNIPAAVLAGSVLYGLGVLNSAEEKLIEDPQPEMDHADVVQDLRACTIPTHMINSSADYNALRRRGPLDGENSEGISIHDVHDWSARILGIKKQIGSNEVFNPDRVQFLIPDSNIKPTTVHTIDGTFPGVSEHYAFSFATGRRPKVGRNEDPY